MKTRSLMLFILTISSCSIEQQPEDFRFFPPRREIALITESQYISHTASAITYEIEVVLLGYYENSEDYIYLPQEDFSFEDAATSQITDFSTIENVAPGGNSSLIFLIDESGSYAEMDYYNTRSQVINKFFHDNTAPNNVLLGAFSRDGALNDQPVEFSGEDFASNWHLQEEYLFGLAKRTGGASALYDALENAMAEFNGDEVNERKELVVFAHATDIGSSASISTVIQQARTQGVRIHTVEFGNELNGALAPLSQQTGGLHVVCPTAEEIATLFNHLERLLNGEWKAYRIVASYQPGVTVQSGFEFTQTLNIHDAEFDFEYNPVYAHIKVP